MCNFVTDGILASAAETKTGKADLAIHNGGALRTNIKAGEITFKDALSVQPFGNTVCIVEISGQTLLDELEMGARFLPNKSGGLLHVSHNVKYTVDTKIPHSVQIDENNAFTGISGERRVKDVTINGEPLDPKRKYTVAATSYVVLRGGDGHVFEGAKIIEKDYIVDADSLAHYLKSFKFIPERYKESQGRITIIK